MSEAMEIDNAKLHDTDVVSDVIEEDLTLLEDWLEQADEARDSGGKIPLYLQILNDTTLMGPLAIAFKERVVYDLTRAYCDDDPNQIVPFLTTHPFLAHLTKSKTAKVVRAVLDIVCTVAPVELQETIARAIMEWTEQEKRSFLRQRVEAKLAQILFDQQKYSEAMSICERLLSELKKLDDKQLLVETSLLESKIQFALRNTPKAKASLTASRTAANSIYVPPALQAEMDTMSGILHTDEGDYNTAHSYFLEAFEQLDQMNDDKATQPLQYMMLCRILGALRAALQLSSSSIVGAKPEATDLTSLLTSKQSVKYAGRNLEALQAIATAASHRNVQEFQQVLQQYHAELSQDLLIKHHLLELQEQLLESNLLKIIEAYQRVELEYVAMRMNMPLPAVERKLSQMILDSKLQGILDQGQGHLIVYESSEKDQAMEKGLAVLANMDAVVTSLFERSKALRTMMI